MELITRLGKIKSIDLVLEESKLGLKAILVLEGSSEVVDFTNWSWCKTIVPAEGIHSWNELHREESYCVLMRRINELLLDAKKDSLQKLVGVPIEAKFKDRNLLQSFRILTEVL